MVVGSQIGAGPKSHLYTSLFGAAWLWLRVTNEQHVHNSSLDVVSMALPGNDNRGLSSELSWKTLRNWVVPGKCLQQLAVFLRKVDLKLCHHASAKRAASEKYF